MKVTISPYRQGVHYGNILWRDKHPMRGGKFPASHPVGGSFMDSKPDQCGNGDNIQAFRARGYWASCFPEGDGITYQPLKGQDAETCMKDVREVFGWEVVWQPGFAPGSVLPKSQSHQD